MTYYDLILLLNALAALVRALAQLVAVMRRSPWGAALLSERGLLRTR